MTPTETATPAPSPAPAPEKLTKKQLAADHPLGASAAAISPCSPPFIKSSRNASSRMRASSPWRASAVPPGFPISSYARRAFHPWPRSPLASGVSLARPDVHVFLFGGDGDGFSIGGNHLEHGARKNINLTYVIMDNFVYGLTKKQTSPTSPLGYKSKTDPTGAIDQPVNPIRN